MFIVHWFISIPWQGQVLTICFVVAAGVAVYWGFDTLRRLRALPPEE